MLTKTKFKLKDKEAVTLCECGLKLARQLNDIILFSEFRFLKTLFTEDSVKELEDILKYLEDKEILPDIEDLATDAAKYYKKMKTIKWLISFMRKRFMPKNNFREGIVFMSIKFTSAFILIILLLGFLGSYITSSFSEKHEARRGQTASVELASDHQSDVLVERRGHTT